MCYLAFKLLRLSRQIKREKLDEVVRQHRRKYGVNDCVNAAARQVSGGRNVSKSLTPLRQTVCLSVFLSFSLSHKQTHTPHINTHRHTTTKVSRLGLVMLGYARLDTASLGYANLGYAGLDYAWLV